MKPTEAICCTIDGGRKAKNRNRNAGYAKGITMAKRRVFKTQFECSGINSRAKHRLVVGQAVMVQKSESGEVEVPWHSP